MLVMTVPGAMPGPDTLCPTDSPAVPKNVTGRPLALKTLETVRILDATVGAVVTPAVAFSPVSWARKAPAVMVVGPL